MRMNQIRAQNTVSANTFDFLGHNLYTLPIAMYSIAHIWKCSINDFSDCKSFKSLMPFVTVSSLEFYLRLEPSLHELLRG